MPTRYLTSLKFDRVCAVFIGVDLPLNLEGLHPMLKKLFRKIAPAPRLVHIPVGCPPLQHYPGYLPQDAELVSRYAGGQAAIMAVAAKEFPAPAQPHPHMQGVAKPCR